MQYVCRSCFLRLGQPWRQRASTRRRPSPSPRLLPQHTFRGNHVLASHVETSGEENHERRPQQQSSPALTIDDGTLTSADEHKASGHTLHRPHEDHPLIAKIPKPKSKLTASTSTFTTKDSRVQFVKELDRLDEESWGLAKVLRRFAEWELFQRERLENSTGVRSRIEIFNIYGAWKSLIKDAFATPPSKHNHATMTIPERRALFWILDSNNLEAMMRSYPSFSQKDWKLYMESTRLIISVALRYTSPSRLRMVLECILRNQRKHKLQYYDFFIIEDVLELLATHLRRMKSDGDERLAYAENMADLVVYAMEAFGTNVKRGGVLISQATIHPILDALPDDAVEPWYYRLQEARCHLHPFTQLHFASRIAKSSPAGKLSSVQILHGLTRTGLLDINSPVAASVCTSILSFGKIDIARMDDQSATPADLFRHLNDIGMVPNVITYSAIIRGLCLRKDLKTALEVFDIMRHHGVQPDEYTYSILINGCKLCKDFRLLTHFALDVCNQNIRDVVIWNEILHGVYLCCMQTSKDSRGKRRTALRALNEVYSRIFDARLLRPFITGRLAEQDGILVRDQQVPEDIEPLGEIPPLPPRELLLPGSDTLSIMLLGLVRSFDMPYDVVVFYNNFRQMLRQGHPVAERLVRDRGTYVHDIVLRSLLRFRGTMRVALDIIRDMMWHTGEDANSNPNQAGPMPTAEAPLQTAVVADAEAPAANTEDDVAYPRDSTSDNTTSDSVLSGESSGSFTEGATAEAEAQVPHEDGNLAPRAHAVQHPAPSVYTWSILVFGFMRHKLPGEAERTLNLMREHGVQPNVVTYNTLAAGYAKLNKIPQAVRAMQRLEADGFQSDDSTLRAFSYINNKQRAIKLMEAAVEKNTVKMQAAELHAQGAEDAANANAVAEEPQEGEDEDEMLDEDLEARFAQTDLGEVPDHVSRQIHDPLRRMKVTTPLAPVREQSKDWERVREQGLSALSLPSGYDLTGRLDLDVYSTSKWSYRKINR